MTPRRWEHICAVGMIVGLVVAAAGGALAVWQDPRTALGVDILVTGAAIAVLSGALALFKVEPGGGDGTRGRS